MNRGMKQLVECFKNEEPQIKLYRLQNLCAAEWEEVYRASTKTALAPLLYHTLKPYFDGLPAAKVIRERIYRIYCFSAARNIRLYHQLLDLVNAFNEAQVEVILLKGSHLAELVYGNPALRPMFDMDLLVRNADLVKADRLLRSRGYSSCESLQGASYVHLAPYSKEGAIAIDIQHHIAEPPFAKFLIMDELWERNRRETIEGVAVLTLSCEDLLLHLSTHAAISHCFEYGLLNCVDVARSVERYRTELDWALLYKRAEAWGMERTLALVLALTEKMVGTDLPGFITETLKNDSEAEEALASAEEIILNPEHSAPRFIARLFGPEPLSVKLRVLLKRLFPAKEYITTLSEAGDDRKPNLFLRARSYLLRVKGVSGRHGRTFWKALRGDPELIAMIEKENKKNRLRRWLGQE